MNLVYRWVLFTSTARFLADESLFYSTASPPQHLSRLKMWLPPMTEVLLSETTVIVFISTMARTAATQKDQGFSSCIWVTMTKLSVAVVEISGIIWLILVIRRSACWSGLGRAGSMSACLPWILGSWDGDPRILISETMCKFVFLSRAVDMPLKCHP